MAKRRRPLPTPTEMMGRLRLLADSLRARGFRQFSAECKEAIRVIEAMGQDVNRLEWVDYNIGLHGWRDLFDEACPMNADLRERIDAARGMFTMNIDTLQPGPEMDRMVAKAMGGEKLAISEAWRLPDGSCKLFRPSTDIADAWRVVEWMEEHRNSVVQITTRFLTSFVKEAWLVRFNEHGTDGIDEATAPTAPHAICLAFLKAMEVK